MNLPNPGRGQTSESEAALGVAPRRAKFIPPLEAEGFLWLICNSRPKGLRPLSAFYSKSRLASIGYVALIAGQSAAAEEICLPQS